MSKVHVGAWFENAAGNKFEVQAKTSTPRYWVVYFPETGYTTTAKDTNIPYGKVKDYLARTVYGVGILGAHIAKPRGSFQRQVYDCWANMLRRCYGGYSDGWKADYTDVEVCPTWHNFLVFQEDIKAVPGYEAWVLDSTMCLDKDLAGQRLYSKATCKFITNAENLSESSLRRWHGSVGQG